MKKFKKSKESKNVKTVDEPITREEQEQYIRDVVAAFDKAWDKLMLLGDENGYVTVDVPMSPEEKRMLGINPSKEKSSEPIDRSDSDFCEKHEFALEDILTSTELTDPKDSLNRLKAAISGAQKSADRLSREIHDLKETADKNGGKIPNINEIAKTVLKEQEESNIKKGKTYVMSDLHGCYDKYMEMLKEIDFSPEDTLYFLGDAIDRGPDGIKIMLDIMERPNIHAILGNHEAMALDALPVLETIKEIYNGRAKDGTHITADDVYKVNLWYDNGCKPTARAYMKLPKSERNRIFRYMKSLPLYREIEVNGEKYVLVHGALGNFSPDKSLKDYSQHDLVWERPKTSTKYYDDKTVIVGHSPTIISLDHSGKIYHGDGFIDIDCGCVYGSVLGCLCIDTMEEFYV